MKITRIAAGLVLVGLSGSVLAATTAEVTVTGTIKPTACTLTLNGATDATVNYGVIAPTLLSSTAITALTVQRVPLRISCDAATVVAVNAFDNKAGTVPFAVGTTVPAADAGADTALNTIWLYGLGGASKTGGYSLALDTTTAKADNKAVFLTSSTDSGATWLKRNGYLGQGSGGSGGYWLTWVSTAAGTAPLAAQTFEASILVKAFINKKSELGLTGESGELALDGSATVEIRYL